jgi:hypothetical protein
MKFANQNLKGGPSMDSSTSRQDWKIFPVIIFDKYFYQLSDDKIRERWIHSFIEGGRLAERKVRVETFSWERRVQRSSHSWRSLPERGLTLHRCTSANEGVSQDEDTCVDGPSTKQEDRSRQSVQRLRRMDTLQECGSGSTPSMESWVPERRAMVSPKRAT